MISTLEYIGEPWGILQALEKLGGMMLAYFFNTSALSYVCNMTIYIEIGKLL